jgi:predicted Zn-dependent protease
VEACAFAAGRYRDLVQRPAETPRALYWRSLAASQLALEAFARLESLPASPEAHEVRAEAYDIRNLHHEAIEEWQRALAQSPGDRRLTEGLARSYWLNQDYALARPLLESLVREAPRSVVLNLELGDTLLQLQQPEAAIPYLQRAVQLAPSNLDAQGALGRAYASTGRWGDAIPHLETAAPADRDGALHRLLARGYAAAGRQEASAKAAERATAIASASATRQQEANSAEIAPP